MEPILGIIVYIPPTICVVRNHLPDESVTSQLAIIATNNNALPFRLIVAAPAVAKISLVEASSLWTLTVAAI